MFAHILTYPLRAWHRHGFDVQSPWAYEMVRDVLFEHLQYYAYASLGKLRGVFSADGASSQAMDEQLFRLANHTSPSVAIEFGSHISACYMAHPHSSTHCILVAPHISDSDINTLKRLGIEVKTTSHLTSLLSPNLVHISRSVSAADSRAIYEWAKTVCDNHTLLVIDNIRKTNKALWRHIVKDDERATVTFDLANRGIISFDKKRVKQNYLL